MYSSPALTQGLVRVCRVGDLTLTLLLGGFWSDKGGEVQIPPTFHSHGIWSPLFSE